MLLKPNNQNRQHGFSIGISMLSTFTVLIVSALNKNCDVFCIHVNKPAIFYGCFGFLALLGLFLTISSLFNFTDEADKDSREQ